MGTSYRAQVAVAFEILAEGLAPFVDARMSATFPGDDWILMAAGKLGKRRDVLVSLSDPHFQLEVMNRWWGPAFSSGLSDGDRARIGELRTSRNHWAHPDQDHPLDIDAALSRRAERRGAAAGHRLERSRAHGRPAGAAPLGVASARSPSSRGSPRARPCSSSWPSSRTSTTSCSTSSPRPARRPSPPAAAAGRCRASWPSCRPSTRPWPACATSTSCCNASSRRSARSARPSSATPPPSASSSTRPRPPSARLQHQSSALNDQLSEARRTLAHIDPIDTEVGKRWLWLISALVMVLGILVVVAAYIPR